MQDLVGGQIDIVFSDAVTALPQIKAGNIKAYAVMAKNRMAVAPDIPTADEAGVPGLYSSVWNALWAPKDTPRPIIDKLNAAVVDALDDADVRKHLTDLGRGIFPARRTDARGARRIAKIRDREMVAHHQGRGDEGRIAWPFGGL